MKEHPLVSVLMTSYNRERYIPEAIESVLSSSYENFELIVVDDLSTDRTLEIAASYASKDPRVKVYSNRENLGDYPNRNQAAAYANGKYIKYLDSDDIIYDFGLEVMVNYMERFPEAGFGLCSLSKYAPVPFMLEPKEIYVEHFNVYGHFDRSPGSSIIRLDAFQQLGGFSGARMIGDYEFWFKIARYYKMVKLPYDLHWYRMHPDQEYSSDYAKKYPELRQKVLLEALNHPDCPLMPEEIRDIMKVIRKRELKNVFLSKLNKIRKGVFK
jgi:glycosyltransferase involved in cell wall biosynthesis